MSQFSCDSLRTYFSWLSTSCYFTPSSERQKQSREKLEQQKLLLGYEKRQLENQVEDCERRKAGFLQQRRVKEAKEVVREKFKILKKYEKTRELFEFTDSLLEQIANTTTLRDTMSTIHEAQRIYMSIDAPRIYKRFDKLSEKFATFQEQVTDTQDMVNSRMSGMTGMSSEDAELLAELDTCDNDLSYQTSVLKPPTAVEQPSLGITQAYARAGLHSTV